MQAVILAAGKSTRAYPLTLTRPKPLLKVSNKTLLEHNLENLIDFVDEAVIVVGYKKDMIKKLIGKKYKSIKIKYALQKKQLGTAHALLMAKPHLRGRFILMMGDDIYSKEDIKNCVKFRYCILVTKVKNPQNFGVVEEQRGLLKDIIEKPQKFVSYLASTAFYTLGMDIFNCIKKIKKSKRKELEMPDAVRILSKYEKIKVVRSKGWLPIATGFDLLNADISLRKSKNYLGKNARITGLVRNSNIGDGCIIEGIVRNSIVMDGTIVDRGSVISDSVIGHDCHVNGKIFKSVISDNVDIINTIVKNSRIWPNKIIKNKAVNKDIE